MFDRCMTNARNQQKRLTIKKMKDGDVLINLEKFYPDHETPRKALGHILKAEDIDAAVAELLKEV